MKRKLFYVYIMGAFKFIIRVKIVTSTFDSNSKLLSEENSGNLSTFGITETMEDS